METHGSPSSNWTGLCAPVGVAGRGVVETRPTVFTELVVLGVTGTELVDELVTVGMSVVLVGVSVVLVDVSAVLVGCVCCASRCVCCASRCVCCASRCVCCVSRCVCCVSGCVCCASRCVCCVSGCVCCARVHCAGVLSASVRVVLCG